MDVCDGFLIRMQGVYMVVRSVWNMISLWFLLCFFFQAKNGIRDVVRSRGLGDVYEKQEMTGGDTVQAHIQDQDF